MFWRAKLCHFALLFLLLAMSDPLSAPPLFAKVVAVGRGGSGGESLGPADPSSSSSENSEHAPSSSSPVAAASFAVAAPQMAAVHLRNVIAISIKYVKKGSFKVYTGVIPVPAPLGTLRESCCYYLWRWAKNRLGVFQKVLK